MGPIIFVQKAVNVTVALVNYKHENMPLFCSQNWFQNIHKTAGRCFEKHYGAHICDRNIL